MATIDDVRAALFDAYQRLAATPGGVEGKSSEGYCELHYPNWWECETLEEFQTPKGVMVYSYALGPNRSHFFWRGDRDSHRESNEWISPDPFAKAVEVINGWAAEIEDRT